MAGIIGQVIGETIQFVSPNLWQFFWHKREERMRIMLILVLIVVHSFPRFQKTPKKTSCVQAITGQVPTSLRAFVHMN